MPFVDHFSILMGSVSRLVDLRDELETEYFSIEGFDETPLVSLEEAIEPLINIVQNVLEMLSKVKKKTRSRSAIQAARDWYGLEWDESDSIALYTLGKESDNLYSSLNQALRIRTPRKIEPWLHFLKLLVTACCKLPSKECAVWRGIVGDVSAQYVKGGRKVWWGFSSCSKDIQVLDRFIKNGELRTIFMIQCIKGKCIQPFSLYKNESEIVLMPGTYLKVEGKLEVSPGVWIIHLQEEIAPDQLHHTLLPKRYRNFTSKPKCSL